MKYLIRANKVVFSGNLQMIMKYVSDFYKSESKLWADKDGNFTDWSKFKTFIEPIHLMNHQWHTKMVKKLLKELNPPQQFSTT